MKNRLMFFKKLYPKYLVFIKSKNKLKLNDIDNKILDFINNHKGYKVNYIIVDNLDIIKCKNYEFNDYDNVFFKIKLVDLINYWRKKVNCEK